MIKPVLPPCSMAGCERAAGAIVNDSLLCGEHAVIALDAVIRTREAQGRKDEGQEEQQDLRKPCQPSAADDNRAGE